jgi:hypothetical protein
MIHWAPVLHVHQSPTQFPRVWKRVCRESYRPLIDILGECHRARATVNIDGALTEMMWHINMIERGLAEQRAVALNAVKAVRASGSRETTALTKADEAFVVSELVTHRLVDRLVA